MKRKIVQHGSSSLTVTLPNKWAEKYRVRKGDEVEVAEEGPALIITTGHDAAAPKATFSTGEYGKFTRNNLSHLYQLGYDEVQIAFDDDRMLEEIRKRLPDCIGFEIIDQKGKTVTIRSIATTIEGEFDNLLRKSFLITDEMAKELVAALEHGEVARLREIRNMEAINNRFTDVCLRILNKRGYKRQHRTMQMYESIKNIERIADDLKRICDLYASARKGPGKEAVALLKEAISYYLAFSEMFFRFDPKLRDRIADGRTRLLERFAAAAPQHPLLAHHLMSLVEKTHEGCGAYFALTL